MGMNPVNQSKSACPFLGFSGGLSNSGEENEEIVLPANRISAKSWLPPDSELSPVIIRNTTSPQRPSAPPHLEPDPNFPNAVLPFDCFSRTGGKSLQGWNTVFFPSLARSILSTSTPSWTERTNQSKTDQPLAARTLAARTLAVDIAS